MNKQKYIHVKTKSTFKKRKNGPKLHRHKPTSIEDYDKLPYRETIKNIDYSPWAWENKTRISFDLEDYLKKHIGCDWNDVYTDLISKTNPRYRHLLERDLIYEPIRPTEIINERPYYYKWFYRRDALLIKRVYIDSDNTLQFFETVEELNEYCKIKMRQKKLERLLNCIEDEDETEDVYLSE